MAYCTAAEVLDMLKEDMLNVIIGDDYIENEDERIQAITPIVEQAIADADAEIDGYLAKRYKVPFGKTPQVINKFAKDIALYNMVSRKGVDENDREKYVFGHIKDSHKYPNTAKLDDKHDEGGND